MPATVRLLALVRGSLCVSVRLRGCFRYDDDLCLLLRLVVLGPVGRYPNCLLDLWSFGIGLTEFSLRLPFALFDL